MADEDTDQEASLSAEPPDSSVAQAERELVFHPEFIEDLQYWVEKNQKIALKVLKLVEFTGRDPFTGIGKPEQLKYLDPDTWSRHITQEHRFVYRVSADRIDFLQARYHYT